MSASQACLIFKIIYGCQGEVGRGRLTRRAGSPARQPLGKQELNKYLMTFDPAISHLGTAAKALHGQRGPHEGPRRSGHRRLSSLGSSQAGSCRPSAQWGRSDPAGCEAQNTPPLRAGRQGVGGAPRPPFPALRGQRRCRGPGVTRGPPASASRLVVPPEGPARGRHRGAQVRGPTCPVTPQSPRDPPAPGAAVTGDCFYSFHL